MESVFYLYYRYFQGKCLLKTRNVRVCQKFLIRRYGKGRDVQMRKVSHGESSCCSKAQTQPVAPSGMMWWQGKYKAMDDKDWYWSSYPPPTKQLHQHLHGRETELLSGSSTTLTLKKADFQPVSSVLASQPDPFPCTRCGKLYKWRTNLLRHIRLECGKEPQFQCPFCPKKTNRNDTLVSHIKLVHRIPVRSRNADGNFLAPEDCR